MSEKDDDLLNLLNPINEINPTRLEMEEWLKSMPTPHAKVTRETIGWIKLIAAVLLGFIMGASSFSFLHKASDQENGGSQENFATIERHVVKFNH